jgi:hypothetical protein
MISSVRGRPRRRAAAASVLTVIAVVAGVLVLAIPAGAPQGWWPRTGQAFAADASSAGRYPCTRVVGPAGDYCERGTIAAASAERPQGTSALWGLVPAGAGLAALIVWRLPGAAGQRRR